MFQWVKCSVEGEFEDLYEIKVVGVAAASAAAAAAAACVWERVIVH